ADVDIAESPPRRTAQKSSEERLAELKTRQRRVALLSDIAEKMLVQGQEDHREAIERNNSWKEMEEMRFRAMMDEGERDRKAIERNANIMQAAVDALNRMGDILTGMQERPKNTQRSQQAKKRVAKGSRAQGNLSHGADEGTSKGNVTGDEDTGCGTQSLSSLVTTSMTQSGGDCRSSKRARAPKKYFSFGD
ncbi:UNVERIFIED_CONTAM: hypothetical protein K2H54_020812, partial [Gekko kuhli]